MSGLTITANQLCKTYSSGANVVEVLRNVDVHIEAGSCVSIVGPSGCGKSTLLHLLGMLDRPTSGDILLGDRRVSSMPDRQLHKIRNREIGFVFQAHHLLPEHSALGNVMIPVRIAGGDRRVAEARASALLNAVGLGHRMHHKPGELSGGEQQRVALARALVMGPKLILADEPTGNLDPQTSNSVFELMLSLNDYLKSTLLVVTHSHQLAKRFPRTLSFEEGAFVDI